MKQLISQWNIDLFQCWIEVSGGFDAIVDVVPNELLPIIKFANAENDPCMEADKSSCRISYNDIT